MVVFSSIYFVTDHFEDATFTESTPGWWRLWRIATGRRCTKVWCVCIFWYM